jgi:phospholipase/carboxylesterase
MASEVRARPPVLLVHGDQDEVIPPEALLFSVQGLASLGVPAQFHMSRGIGHGIDADGLGLGGAFLAKALSDPATC